MNRFLRGPLISAVLRQFGIDPRRYWLLMDLFGQLSERREMLSQLGREGITLKTVAWLYFALMALFSLMFAMAGPPQDIYLRVFLAMTGFVLFTILFSETGNSLVNPVEGLVLAHQPINGATYIAAKLTHLLRILFYLVPALNAVPALAGLALTESNWFYPIRHLSIAFAVGLTTALLCCAIFGWLIRLIPAPRLKSAGQMAEMLPWLAFAFFQPARDFLARTQLLGWLPAGDQTRMYLGVALGVVIVGSMILGLRALSADYLVRVSSIVHGTSAAKTKLRKSRLSNIAAWLFGGPPSRAGFEYVSCMMVRDWQFRRQLIPILPVAIGPLVLLARSARTTPFSGEFTGVHLLPHAFGIVLFVICTVLVYGADFKGAWIFLLAPGGAFARFARGVYAMLWLKIVVIPHLVMLVVLAWFWGILDGSLFVGYSLAVASTYLALELRLIEGMPFSKQADASRGPFMIAVMIVGGLVMTIAVGLQYLLVFRSRPAVMIVTIVLGVGTYFLTRSSLESFEVAIRYNLGLLSTETGTLYKEIDA